MTQGFLQILEVAEIRAADTVNLAGNKTHCQNRKS